MAGARYGAFYERVAAFYGVTGSPRFTAFLILKYNIAPPKILEEPLAVVVQKVFLRTADPERFGLGGTWYGDPWISTFARLAFDAVSRALEGGGTLDEALVKRLAKSCKQLAAVGALFAPRDAR